MMNTPDAVLRRTMMLMAGGISLVIAFAGGLSLEACRQSTCSLVNVATIVLMGFTGALGFRAWASTVLWHSAWPWYAHPGAVLLSLVSMILLNAFALWIIEEVMLGHGLRNAPPTPACLFLMVGVELLVIALTDWPMGNSAHRSHWHNMLRPPGFRPYRAADHPGVGPVSSPRRTPKKPSFRPYVPDHDKSDRSSS